MRRRRRRRRSLETRRRDRGISVRGARISRGVRAHLELEELLHGVGLVSHRAPTRLTRGADFCVRGLEGRRARVSREGGGGRAACGCFAGGDASTKATGWARRTTGASVECGAPRLGCVQNEPKQAPEYSCDGRREGHSSFPAPKRHNASRGQTRRDGDDACLRVPRGARGGVSPLGRRGLRGRPGEVRPAPAGARGSTRGIPNASHVCSHDTPISEGPHDSPRLPTLPLSSQAKRLRYNGLSHAQYVREEREKRDSRSYTGWREAKPRSQWRMSGSSSGLGMLTDPRPTMPPMPQATQWPRSRTRTRRHF